MPERVMSLALLLAVLLFFKPGLAHGSSTSECSLSGRVVERDNKPIRADVTVYERNIVQGRRDLAALCSTTTDPKGRYECTHLRPGQYVVSVMPRSLSPTAPDQKQDFYARTFYPSITDLATATPIRISAGQSGVADVVIRAVDAVTLHGKLPGTPLSASITVLSRNDGYDLPSQASASYDPVTGEALVKNAPVGAYKILADWWASGAMHHAAALVEVHDRGSTAQLSFSPVVVHHLYGSLHFASACDDCLPRTIELRRVDNGSNWYVRVAVDHEGSFSLPEIADGDYVLSASDPKTVFIKEIDVSGQLLPGKQLHLYGESGPESLDVEVSRTGSSLSGELEPSQLLPGSSGVVIQNTANGIVDVVRADKLGKFQFVGLDPAEYRVFAWHDLDEAEYRNPEFLARFRSEATVVSIDDSKSRVADLQLSVITLSK